MPSHDTSPPKTASTRHAILGYLKQNRWIIAIAALAFLLRLAWLILADALPVSDFNQYLGAAQDLLEYGQYGYPEPTAYRLPLYSLSLAGLLLVSESVAWLSFWSVVASTSICVLVYFVSVRFGLPKRAALIAAFLVAVFPQYVFFAPVLASEHLLAVLVLSALLAATAPGRSGAWRAIVAGVLVGAATLTRGDGLIFGVIILGYVIYTTQQRTSGPIEPTKVAKLVLAFGVTALVVISPWIIRNEVVMGRGTLMGSNSGQAFWYGHNPQGYGFIALSNTPMSHLDESKDEAEIQRLSWELAFEYIAQNPASLIQSAQKGTSELLAPGLQNWGVFWSTRDGPARGTREDLSDIFNVGSGVSIAASWFITVSALLALLNVRAIGTRVMALTGLVVFSTWLFYAVIFLGNPRYRYMVDIFLCMATASLVVLISGFSPRGQRTGGSDERAQTTERI